MEQDKLAILLDVEIPAERKRLKALPSDVSPTRVLRELDGTCLSMLNDFGEELRQFRALVWKSIEEHADHLDSLEDRVEGEQDSRLIQDDAKLLREACEMLKLLASQLLDGKAPDLAENREHLMKVVAMADKGLEIIEDIELPADDDEETPDE